MDVAATLRASYSVRSLRVLALTAWVLTAAALTADAALRSAPMLLGASLACIAVLAAAQWLPRRIARAPFALCACTLIVLAAAVRGVSHDGSSAWQAMLLLALFWLALEGRGRWMLAGFVGAAGVVLAPIAGAAASVSVATQSSILSLAVWVFVCLMAGLLQRRIRHSH